MRACYAFPLVPILQLQAANSDAQTASPVSGLHTVSALPGLRGGTTCDTIDFDALPANTVVTDQFLACGVVFEDAAKATR